MKGISSILFVCCFYNSFSQGIAVQFSTFGDKPVICIAPTNDGGFISLMKYDNTIGSDSKPILVKTDDGFNTIWSKKLDISGVLSYSTTTVQQLTDGGYLLFYLGNNMAKFDAAGNLVWNTNVVSGSIGGGGYTLNRKCIEKPDGKLLVVSTDYVDFKVFQFSSAGTFEWGKRFSSTDPGGYGKCPGFDILAQADGSVFVSGKRGNDNCFARMDNLGNVLWTNVIDFDDTYSRPYAMTEMEDGNVLVVGLRSDKGFLMKMSIIDGSIVWQKEVNEAVLYDVISMGDNKYGILGKDLFSGDDLAVTIFDGDGELLDAKKFMNYTDPFSNPKFLTNGSKFYYTSLFGSWTSSKLSLVEFDPTLIFLCNDEPVSLSKISFTLPLISLGPLDVSVDVPGYTYSMFGVSDVASTIDFATFCEITTAEPTVMNESIPNPIIGENMGFTSINENSLSVKITVYPNPVSENSPIAITLPTGGDYSVQLMDMYGKVIFKNNFNGSSTSISSSNLSKGIYLLKVTSNNSQHQFTQKLVVE